ncbi:UNVERIFIED_ORG: dihydrodipicolinate synthase/N-acetylneuraminate lyase [Pseudomonas reinekei]|nr:dihydrodipicolinate synthase/N-acetylneuraminate lyase [Pseudomonas reinekei]
MQLHRQIRDNQLAEGRATFFRLLPLINSLFLEPNPAPVKTALALQGLIGDELRAPMQRSSDSMTERLKGVLRTLDSDNR